MSNNQQWPTAIAVIAIFFIMASCTVIQTGVNPVCKPILMGEPRG